MKTTSDFSHKLLVKLATCGCSVYSLLVSQGANSKGKLSHYRHMATKLCKSLVLNLKNDNLDVFLSGLTTFSMWAVVQQQHVLTSSVCLTVHIDMCRWCFEKRANHIFWQNKRKAHWVFLFLSEMKTRRDGHSHRCFLAVCIAECTHCRRENQRKMELLIGRNAPSCELDPTWEV